MNKLKSIFSVALQYIISAVVVVLFVGAFVFLTSLAIQWVDTLFSYLSSNTKHWIAFGFLCGLLLAGFGVIVHGVKEDLFP